MENPAGFCRIEIRIKVEGRRERVLALKREIRDSLSQFKGLTTNLKIELEVDEKAGF